MNPTFFAPAPGPEPAAAELTGAPVLPGDVAPDELSELFEPHAAISTAVAASAAHRRVFIVPRFCCSRWGEGGEREGEGGGSGGCRGLEDLREAFGDLRRTAAAEEDEH